MNKIIFGREREEEGALKKRKKKRKEDLTLWLENRVGKASQNCMHRDGIGTTHIYHLTYSEGLIEQEMQFSFQTRMYFSYIY